MSHRHSRSQGRPIVVDGSNIAFESTTRSGKPTLDAIQRVYHELQRMGYRPIVIVDAALRHQIDDPEQYEQLVSKGVLKQAPAGTDGDYFVLCTARDEHARIVTNDQYKDYRDEFQHIDQERVPVMIVDGNVEFYHLEPAHSHAGT